MASCRIKRLSSASIQRGDQKILCKNYKREKKEELEQQKEMELGAMDIISRG